MGTLAIVCPRFPPEYGGPGIALQRMAPRFAEKGIRTLVFCGSRRDLQERTADNGMEIIRIGWGEGRLGRGWFQVRVALRLIANRRKYERIHVFSAGWLTFIVPVLGKVLARPTTFMMTLLDSDDPVGILSTRFGGLKTRLFKYYDNYIAINPEQERRIANMYGSNKRVITGSAGIDIRGFSPPTSEERRRARQEFGISPSVKVAAFAGNICERKGIREAVEVWLEVTKALPDAVFLVLGPGFSDQEKKLTLYPDLVAMINRAGKEDNFRFLWREPSQDTVRTLMHASDLYLFPSHREGTPSSVLEAMACGVPPVLTPLKGFSGHIVRDSVEGVILDPSKTRNEWAKRIVELLVGSALRKKMGRKGRERVIRYHSQEVALKAYCEAWGIC